MMMRHNHKQTMAKHNQSSALPQSVTPQADDGKASQSYQMNDGKAQSFAVSKQRQAQSIICPAAAATRAENNESQSFVCPATTAT
jgi:hypothetical protein